MAQPFQDFYQQFRDEGKVEGKVEGLQGVICDILSQKFGDKSRELQQVVKNISDSQTLNNITVELSRTKTLKAAQKAIISAQAKLTVTHQTT